MIKKTVLCSLLATSLLSTMSHAEPGESHHNNSGSASHQAMDELNNQERQMLRLAQRFAQQCEKAMEAWMSQEETTKEKLFGFLYYPVQGTDPPKFRTDWDTLADRDIRPIEDDILSQSSSLVFAVLVDKHGYLPAHNTRYAQPLTGNAAVDLVNNRTKRIFADKTGLAAARNEQRFLFQRYMRDTGEKMADLSVPIYIHGKKWGSVRLGYRAASTP